MISVLYVDDETALLEIGKRFLERGGFFLSIRLNLPQKRSYILPEKGTMPLSPITRCLGWMASNF